MGNYWSGSTVCGLLLTGSDIDYFKAKYIEMNPWEFKETPPHERMEVMDEWLSCNEQFRYAADGNENYFYAQYYGDEHFEGMYFTPSNNNPYGLIESRDLPILFIEAEKLLLTSYIITHGYYRDLKEMIDEFRNKMGAYLPHDFDYESAIGDLS